MSLVQTLPIIGTLHFCCLGVDSRGLTTNSKCDIDMSGTVRFLGPTTHLYMRLSTSTGALEYHEKSLRLTQNPLSRLRLLAKKISY